VDILFNQILIKPDARERPWAREVIQCVIGNLRLAINMGVEIAGHQEDNAWARDATCNLARYSAALYHFMGDAKNVDRMGSLCTSLLESLPRDRSVVQSVAQWYSQFPLAARANEAGNLFAAGKYGEAHTIFSVIFPAVLDEIAGSPYKNMVSDIVTIYASTKHAVGQVDASISLCEEYLEIGYREAWTADMLGWLWNIYGLDLMSKGSVELARYAYSNACDLLTGGANAQGYARALTNYSGVFVRLGRFVEAEKACRDAIAVKIKLRVEGVHAGIATNYECLGGIAGAQGNLSDAATWFAEAGKTFEESGDHGGVCRCLASPLSSVCQVWSSEGHV
jgi:tetratricopeptide (TPR) repeat protein